MRNLMIMAVLFLGTAWLPRTIEAQVSLPPVSFLGHDVDNPLPASAAQGNFNTRALMGKLETLFPSSAPRYPKDSLKRVSGDRATTWLQRYANDTSASRVSGMQLDYLARLSVVANNDADARRIIATRLATPGLSRDDRAFTLMTAFTVFLDPDRTNRIAVAKEYLVQIDALGGDLALLSVDARSALAQTYYKLGIADSVIRYGREAIERVLALPFLQRDFHVPLIEVADALVPRSNGRAEIKMLSTRLWDAAWPPAELQSDSANIALGLFNRRDLKPMIQTAELLGNPVPKVVGHYWLNTPAEQQYREELLADGKIHVVEFGHFHCPYCVKALPAMKRLGDRFARDPRVGILYATHIAGYWGIKPVSPAEEVTQLKQYYVNTRGLSFPIAIWAPERAHTEIGDYQVPESPNTKAFFVTGTPRFCVVDGQGRLRRVIQGYNRKDFEDEVLKIVNFLLASTAQTSSHASL